MQALQLIIQRTLSLVASGIPSPRADVALQLSTPHGGHINRMINTSESIVELDSILYRFRKRLRPANIGAAAMRLEHLNRWVPRSLLVALLTHVWARAGMRCDMGQRDGSSRDSSKQEGEGVAYPASAHKRGVRACPRACPGALLAHSSYPLPPPPSPPSCLSCHHPFHPDGPSSLHDSSSSTHFSSLTTPPLPQNPAVWSGARPTR